MTGSYQRTLLKIIDSDAPVDPLQMMGRLSLFQEDGTPITLEDLLGGGGGGGVPNPVTFIDLMPYVAAGVEDYKVNNPSETFDHPGYYVNGGQVFLNGVFDTTDQAGGLIATWPAAIRPRATRSVKVETQPGTKTLYIAPNGEVKMAGGGVPASFCVLGGSYLL